MKVVIVHNIIAPYRIQLFNLLASSPGIDLTVLFMAASEANRQWEVGKVKRDIRFSYEVLAGIHLRAGESTIHINPLLLPRLRALRPEVVIVTGVSAATAMCLAYRGVHRSRVVAWWAGTRRTEKGLGAIRRAWRSLLMPRLDAFLCYSQASADYLREAGIASEKIVVAGNVTFDADEFQRRVDQARGRAAAWRKRMELTDGRVVLSVGQLIPRKNHQGLLVAFSMIQARLKRTALVIVGAGPQRAELVEAAAARGLRHVVFAGHVQPDELAQYYAAADLFVDLTLRDHWSQVVGEAMAAGLPVVVSSADHACELIEHGRSGFIVEADDLHAVSSTALTLLASRRRSTAVGEAAFEAVREHDVRHTLQAFVSCLDHLGSDVPPTRGRTAQGVVG